MDGKDEINDYLSPASTSNHLNTINNDDNFIDLNYSEEESGDEEKNVEKMKSVDLQIIAEKVD